MALFPVSNRLLSTAEGMAANASLTAANTVELGLGGKEQEQLARIQRDTTSQRLFADGYPRTSPTVSLERIVGAIAAFERSLVSGQQRRDIRVHARRR